MKNIHDTRPLFGLLIIISGLSAMACNNANTNDLKRYINAIENQKQNAVDEYPVISSSTLRQYTGKEFRDPFVMSGLSQSSFSADYAVTITKNNCQVPQAASKGMSILPTAPLKTMKMKGFFVSNGVRWGLISDANGTLHEIKQGSIVGDNYGYVTKVNEKTISVVEYFKQSSDCWLSKTVQITTAKQSEKDPS